MKKLLITLGFAAAAVSFIPANVSAYSGSGEWQSSDESSSVAENEGSYSDWNTDRCNRIADRLTNLNAKFDQDNDHRLAREQRLIDRQNENDCPVSGTIVDTLVANGNFTTLTAAVQAAGLVDALNAPGEKTLFAPTDQAFAKLPAGTVESLLADTPALTAILTNHVVAGNVDAATASTLTTATALNGTQLRITTDECGNLYINDSKVILSDIRTTNGIVHVIDAVITQ